MQQQQQQPPVSLQADSVADMKRELKQRLEVETSSSPDETNTTTSETGSGPNAVSAATTAAEYQTMERSPLYESSTFRPAEGRRALPTTPPASEQPRSFNYAPESAARDDHRPLLLETSLD